jgi:SET domain-containing protein
MKKIGNKVFLIATKDIYKKEEIFVSYGFKYWEWFYNQLANRKKQTQQ